MSWPPTADAVRSFVIAESSCRGTGLLKNQVTAVRSLLRFLHLSGRIPGPMDGAAPAAAGWHRPPLTRKIRPGDVGAILASCDRGTHAGRRDYAILMLLARLGLRAGEAAAARAGDIDWRSGSILVRGKGGHDERLPLPPDVGAAIADYCRHGRPAGAGSVMLFLHVRAPYGRVSPSTVGNVVKRACLRAGLERQRPSAAARRRDGDAAGRGPAVGDQPAAAPPARGHDIEVRHHRPGRARSRDSPVAGGSVMTGLRGQVRGYPPCAGRWASRWRRRAAAGQPRPPPRRRRAGDRDRAGRR